MPQPSRYILEGLLLAGMTACLLLVLTLKVQVTTIQSSLGVHVDSREELSNKLLHFQEVLSDSKRWPINSVDVEKLWDEFEEFYDENPAKMPVDLRRQLSAAKWCVAALSCLTELRNCPATQFDALEDECHQFLNDVPPRSRISSVSTIHEQLESELGAASLRLRQERMSAAKSAAESALSNNKNLQAVVRDLEPYKEDPSVRELWQQIHFRVLEEAIRSRV